MSILIGALALKGGTAITSYVAHHAVAAKVGVFLYKWWQIHTVGQLVAAGAADCIVVGGVKWGIDNIDRVKKGAMAVKEGNVLEALANFGKVAYTLKGGVTTLPEATHSALLQLHFSEDDACRVAGWISYREKEIANYVTK